MSVQRWDLDGERYMREYVLGDYVEYADYVELEAKLAALQTPVTIPKNEDQCNPNTKSSQLSFSQMVREDTLE